MAKRFTETDIWKKKWFRKLSPKMKCAWQFLTAQCNHAGVWEIDIDLMGIFIGDEIEEEELFNSFGDRIEKIGSDKLWLVDFCSFQYGELKENYNPHKPAIKILEKYNLFSRVAQGLPKACPSLMEKDKEKEKDKDKEKDKEKESELETFFATAKAFWKEATGTGTMANAKKKINNHINSSEKREALLLAIKNYGEVLKVESDRPIKTSLDTFIGSPERGLYYLDYVDSICVEDARKRASRKNSVALKSSSKINPLDIAKQIQDYNEKKERRKAAGEAV